MKQEHVLMAMNRLVERIWQVNADLSSYINDLPEGERYSFTIGCKEIEKTTEQFFEKLGRIEALYSETKQK